MTGATITPTGTPAADNCSRAFSRAWGPAVRGSNVRLMSLSRVVMLNVTATPIWVDRLIEPNVRGVVGGDHALGAIRQHRLRERRDPLLVLLIPAIVGFLDDRGFKADWRVRQGTPPFEVLGAQDAAGHQ